jgi:hypothetical protein
MIPDSDIGLPDSDIGVYPISGIPDIGEHPISGIPISGIISEYTDMPMIGKTDIGYT